MKCFLLANVFVCALNLVENVCIIIVIVVVLCSDSASLDGNSAVLPTEIPTAQCSSCRLQNFPFYLQCSKYSCSFLFLSGILVLVEFCLSCCFFYVSSASWLGCCVRL